MNSTNHRKPDPRLKFVKVYLGEEELATVQSFCHATDTNGSAFLRRAGLNAVAAHQQVIRPPCRQEGPSAGRGRALSFPGHAVRRASRVAFRPMRS